MAAKLYQNDVGVIIRRKVTDRETGLGVNLSNATELRYLVEEPDTTPKIWTAVVSPTDPTKMDHTVAAGELHFRGKFRLQAVVSLPGGVELSGEVESIEVGQRLKVPAPA